MPRLLLVVLCFALFYEHSCAMPSSVGTDTLCRSVPYVMAKVDVGSITQTNDFLRGENAAGRRMSDYHAYTLGVGWQTQGGSDWHYVYDMPSFGIGLYTATLDNKSEIGRPWSLFGFYKGTMFRFGKDLRHALHYNVELGLAWNWRYFDENTNPYNITIGSPVTAHIGVGIEYSYTLADRLVMGVGLGATHFSNGAVRKPNKGLNLVSPQVRVCYLFNRVGYVPYRRGAYVKEKGNEFDLTLGMGVKRYECDTVQHPDLTSEFKLGNKFFVSTLQAEFLHQYSQKGKYGGGLSLCYDEWYGSDVRPVGSDVKVVKGEAGKRFNVGLFAAHEFCIYRLAVLTQLGCYVYQPSGVPQQKKRLFERAGVKYTFPFNLFMGVNIYAHNFTKADFIEWNTGYSLKFKRRESR